MSGALSEQSKKIQAHFPDMQVSHNEDWISILVNEENMKVVDVLSDLQKHYMIKDMQLEEISSEDVVKKIYEGGVQ